MRYWALQNKCTRLFAETILRVPCLYSTEEEAIKEKSRAKDGFNIDYDVVRVRIEVEE